MSENELKTVYTQDEVKAMICACLKGINAPNRLEPVIYDASIYQMIDEVQNQFSQILRILNAEYNEICKAVEADEREGDNDGKA